LKTNALPYSSFLEKEAKKRALPSPTLIIVQVLKLSPLRSEPRLAVSHFVLGVEQTLKGKSLQDFTQISRSLIFF